jgi:hypothetical protein
MMSAEKAANADTRDLSTVSDSDEKFYRQTFVERERKSDLCTAKQAAMLAKLGVRDPQNIRFEDVDRVLKEAIENAEPRLTPCPEHHGGVHLWLSATACELLRHKWTRELIAAYLGEHSQNCGRPVPKREIEGAINYAEREINAATSDFRWQSQDPYRKAQYEPDKLKRVANRLGDADPYEIIASRSKFTTWNRSPAGILHKLFREKESAIVFDVFESQGQAVWTHPGIAGDLSTLNYFELGHQNVWFLPNPVDGKYHWNPREKKDSRRSEEAITAFRFGLIESDQAPKDLWLRALVQMPLPVACVTDSGGASIHALVLVGATTKAEWDALFRDKFKDILVTFGADPGSITAVRLSRLGNCMRESKGQKQTLLYLTDSPTNTPICELAAREGPGAIEARILATHAGRLHDYEDPDL